MAVWMLYIIVVSLLVGLAALLVEQTVDPARGGRRWIWVGAFAGTLLVVFAPGPTVGSEWLAELTERWTSAGLVEGAVAPAVAPGMVGGALEPAQANATTRALGWMGGVDGAVLAAWLAVALLLLVRWLWAAHRVRRQLRSWPTVELPEGRVMVSADTGPAVVGLLRHRVVLPRWCLELPAAERGLIVAHEREHLQARDGLLLAGATLLTLLMPWNLPFWGYRRRLREAVETDCDARVLRRRPAARHAYGSLLLTVAARPAAGRSALLTFSPRSSALGRRIDMLTSDTRGISGIRTLSLLAGALMLVAVSCLVPGPDQDGALPTGPDAETALEEQSATELDEVAREPTFTPFTQAPELTNRSEVAQALQAAYPDELRDAGIGGTAIVHVFVDDEGTVRNVQIAEPSGHEVLDRAAERMALEFSFTPAMNRGERVPVWISLPVTFRTDEGAADERVSPADADEVDEGPRDLPPPERTEAAEPTFTPFTVAPEVRNRAEVSRALQAAYPDELRDAGIGGTAIVHLFIDEEGEVQNVLVSESSGHEDLDRAAERVALEFDFTPALNRDEKVAVWIQLPITFQER